MVKDNMKKYLIYIMLALSSLEGCSQKCFSYEIYAPESPLGLYYARLADPSNQNSKVHISILGLKGKVKDVSAKFFCDLDTIQCAADTNGQLDVEFYSCPRKVEIHTFPPFYGMVLLPISAKIGSQLYNNQIDTLYIVLGNDDYRLLVDSPFELDLNQIEEIRTDWIKNKCSNEKYRNFNIIGLIEL